MTPPIVSIVIPARNEERYIEDCLAHVAAQDYPLERIEVLVVDGASADRTAALAEMALAGVSFARAEVIGNPVGTTPSNLNRGLTEAAGEYLCRVDARSFIPQHYVRTCVEVLGSRPEVAVVGGAQVAIPPRPDPMGIGIARALNNRYAMGFSRYRRGAASGPSDTVYLGAFRVSDVREAGGWDGRLETNQDFDLNRRMGARGLVWFDATLSVRYAPRDSLIDLFRQYRRFGRWKVRYWRQTGDRPTGRQLVLLLGPPAVAALAGLALARVRRVRAGGLILIAVGVATVERNGAREPAGSLAARALAVAAMMTTTSGWLAGVGHEVLCASGER